MARHKRIRRAFIGLGKSGHPAELPQMLKIRLAACQHLMDIRLVSDIKNQTVFHCIKNGLNGHGELHRTQIGGQMAACFGDAGNKKFPDFAAKLRPFGIRQLDQIFVTVDFRKNTHKSTHLSFIFLFPEQLRDVAKPE